MFDLITAAALGALQGLTEFLPVSSSGHLVLAHKLFPVLDGSAEVAFDVAVHVGTLVALFVVYLMLFLRLARAALLDRGTEESRLFWAVAIGTVPAVVLGLSFERWIELYLRSPWVVAVTLFAGALIILAAERWGSKRRPIETVTLAGALAIGFGQALALIPGMSRSGMTIASGLGLGLTRRAAVDFSFLLGVPIIAAAGVKKTWDAIAEGIIAGDMIWFFAVGVVSAAVVGVIAIRFLLRFIKTHSFRPFAYYRIALAVVLVIVLVIR